MYSRNGIRSVRHILDLCLAVLVVASPLATLQAHASAAPGVLSDVPPEGLMVLLPSRAVESVRSDLEAAERLEKASNSARESAEEYLKVAKAQITVCTSEIDVLKDRVKLAKEQKNQTEQDSLERHIKAKDLQLKMLEARRDMREAEIGLADAQRRTAETSGGTLKKELELIERREMLVQISASREVPPDPIALTKLQTEVRDIERQTIEAMKDLAQKQKDAAEREMDVLDKRLNVHEAQLAVLVGPKN